MARVVLVGDNALHAEPGTTKLTRQLCLIAGAVALTIGSFGAVPPPAPGSPAKLDRAVAEWSARGANGPVPVLIRTTSGAADAVMARLQPVADW